MKLEINREVKCNRYSVIIKFKEYGSTVLTPEDEQKIIDDFCPKFKLSDITFEGKYSISNKKFISDDASGEDVTLTLPNKEIFINDELQFGYTIHTDEIKESEIKTNLKSKDLVAKAKVQLFIDKATEKIDTILKEFSETLDEFEDVEEIQVG